MWLKCLNRKKKGQKQKLLKKDSSAKIAADKFYIL